MSIEAAILLLDLINRGIDTAIKLKFTVDKILSMSPEEVKAAIESEHMKTDLLMEIAHKI